MGSQLSIQRSNPRNSSDETGSRSLSPVPPPRSNPWNSSHEKRSNAKGGAILAGRDDKIRKSSNHRYIHTYHVPDRSESSLSLFDGDTSTASFAYDEGDAYVTPTRSNEDGSKGSVTPSRDSRSMPSERSGGRRGASEHKQGVELEADNDTAATPGQSSPRSVGYGIDPENAPGFYVSADGQEYYLSMEGKEFYKDPITGGYYADGFGATARSDNDFGFFVDADGREYFVDEQGFEHYKDDDAGTDDFGFFVDAGGRDYFLDMFGIEHFKEDNMNPHPIVVETGFFLDVDGMEYYLDGKGREYYKNPIDGEFYTHPHQECEGGQKLQIRDLPAKDKRDWDARQQMKQ